MKIELIGGPADGTMFDLDRLPLSPTIEVAIPNTDYGNIFIVDSPIPVEPAFWKAIYNVEYRDSRYVAYYKGHAA